MQNTNQINPIQMPIQNIPPPTNTQQQKTHQDKTVALPYPKRKPQKVIPSYVSHQNTIPPSVLSDFVTKESFNSSPAFIRSTLYQVPLTNGLLKTTGIPFAITIEPLALGHPQDDPINVVDFGEKGPIRCSRCGGYISPFAKFLKLGYEWQCPLCNMINNVPNEYFANVDANNVRSDINSRPELSRGSVEFIASPDYFLPNEKIHPPSYIFVIEANKVTFELQLFHDIIQGIKNSLDQFPDSARVGLVTFGNYINFYDFSDDSNVQMLVVSDVDDVFLPLPETKMCNLSESRDSFEALLDSLPKIVQPSTTQSCTIGSAIKAASLMLQKTGGKIISFNHTISSVGEGPLIYRHFQSIEKERELLLPQNEFYSQLGDWCLDHNISVDMIILRNNYVDLATITQLSRITGGDVYYYERFIHEKDGEYLQSQISKIISKPTAFSTVMRLRTSPGISITKVYSSLKKTDPEVYAAAISTEQSISFILDHDQDLPQNSQVYLQFAMLYTTKEMQRRIRVYNLSLQVSSNLSEIMKSADQEMILNIFAKKAISELTIHPTRQIQDRIIQQCVNIISSYRQFCTQSQYGKIILPERLANLPLYCLGLLKHKIFRIINPINLDHKIALMNYILSLPVHLTPLLFYPRLLSLHNLSEQMGKIHQPTQMILTPEGLKLSTDSLNSKGLFLLDDGLDIYIWAGIALEDQYLQDVFNIEQIEQIEPLKASLPLLKTELSQKINQIISQLKSRRVREPSLQIIRGGDPQEKEFMLHFVEDKIDHNFKYIDFMRFLTQQSHKK
ncbi:sec24-related protein [Anaeramoeba ignava]|uniref:Sec24-related protein n=1 Tax=Anaeramoeba ignava TaxID=1746090 RepID=A0A9Q0RG91_ANAIG|nr:sec24-related protein [Anaeramoeba ignava]